MSTSGTGGPERPEQTLSRLLGSMSADRPRSGSKRATLAALGLGTAAAATTASAGALGSAGALAKLAVTGALFGFATGGAALGARYVLAPEPPPRSAPVAPRVPAAPAPQRRPVAENLPLPAPRASSPDGAEQRERPGASPVRAGSGALQPEPPGSQPFSDRTGGPALPAVATFDTTPAPESLLREETQKLDRARAALAAGDASAGLAALERYASAFPQGELSREATLLRIKALVMAGDRAGAQALARAFVAARPRDPHVEELRSLLER